MKNFVWVNKGILEVGGNVVETCQISPCCESRLIIIVARVGQLLHVEPAHAEIPIKKVLKSLNGPEAITSG